MPYLAGLYALACQVKPTVTPEYQVAPRDGVNAAPEPPCSAYAVFSHPLTS